MSKPKPPKPSSRRAELRAAAIAQAERKKRQRIVFGIVGALVALVLIFAAYAGFKKFQDAQAATTPPSATKDKDGMILNPGKARSGAPVVAVFHDYQCPACKSLEDKFGEKLNEMANAGEIQLENHTMYFLDTNLRNDASQRAANAAMCADAAGHYAAYHEEVYKNQPQHEGTGYTDTQLSEDFAKAAGIQGDALSSFQACYKARTFDKYVKQMDVAAGKSGITGTPTIMVNGKVLDNKQLTGDVNSIKTAIERMTK